MRQSPIRSNSDISAASAVQWLAYMPSAGISRRNWRKIIATGSVYRSAMNEWRTQSNLSFHVCSPDTAIPTTRYAPSGVFSTTRWSMSSRITRDLRHHSSRRWCRLNQYQSLLVWKKRRRQVTYHTSMTSILNQRDRQSSLPYLDPDLSGLPWLPSKLFADASSATDSRSSYVTYTST